VSATLEKFARLCDSLWVKTTEKKVPWRFEGSTITFDVGNNVFFIRKTSNSNGDDLYVVNLLNNSGAVLEAFDDETLHDMRPSSNFDTYYRLLEALFERAKRQATGADEALDDLLRKLDSDSLDFPF
jgi:hypothetical protein